MPGKLNLTLFAAGVALFTSPALAVDKVTVGYFLEWPTPNQVAQVDKTYDEIMGVEVEWRAFGNGSEMAQAMVSGDVQIGYAMGFVPFVVGVTRGAELEVISIPVTYAENDLCIVRDDAGITKENAKDLEGKRIATTIGNVTHYKLLRTLEELGVDSAKVELVQMNPADAALALVRGDVPMACAYGGALFRMREVGSPLLTGAEQEALGIYAFDVITVNKDFAANHADLVQSFLKVTEEANAAYLAKPDANTDKIAMAAGMDVESAKNMMALFGYPSISEQLGKDWLGGGIEAAAKGVAELMVQSGNLDNALDDYSGFVNPTFLEGLAQ